MPRKRKDQDTEAASKPRSKKTAPLADALQELADKAGMVTADQLPRQLEPPTVDLSPEAQSLFAARVAKSRIEPNHAMPEPPQAEPSWKDRVDRPVFGKVPEHLYPVWRNLETGVRVLKDNIKENGYDRSVAYIQFAENRKPTPEETAILKAVGSDDQDARKFTYRNDLRMWARKGQHGEPLGSNTIDAEKIAESISENRKAREGHRR